MPSLFDKLTQISQTNNESKATETSEPKEQPQAPQTEEPPAQCPCGGGLKEECPECNSSSEPSTEGESLTTSERDLMARLKEIGDTTGINPPAPGEPTPATGMCPHCKKTFKHLSRHKCKEAASSEPQKAAPAPEPEHAKLPVGGTSEKPVTPPQGTLEIKQLQPGGSLQDPELKQLSREAEQEREALQDQRPEPEGFILMLDAIIERNGFESDEVECLNVQHFSDIIAPLARAVAKENQVAHWGAVEYGRGGPLLAAKLHFWLKKTKPSGIILADSQTPELRAVKEFLKFAARVVIQGVR